MAGNAPLSTLAKIKDHSEGIMSKVGCMLMDVVSDDMTTVLRHGYTLLQKVDFDQFELGQLGVCEGPNVKALKRPYLSEQSGTTSARPRGKTYRTEAKVQKPSKLVQMFVREPAVVRQNQAGYLRSMDMEEGVDAIHFMTRASISAVAADWGVQRKGPQILKALLRLLSIFR